MISLQQYPVYDIGKFIPRIMLHTLRIVCVFLCCSAAVKAEVTSLLVVSGDGPIHKNISAGLHAQLAPVVAGQVVIAHMDKLPNHDVLRERVDNASLVIAVGTQAAHYMADYYPDRAVLSVLVTGSSFQQLEMKLGQGTHRYFGLLIDQPLERYFALVKKLLPMATRLSIAGFEPFSSALREGDATKRQCSFQLQRVQIEDTDNPIRLLAPYFSESNAFIALPQPGLIDRNHAKWILYLASRHRKPVIGFSSRYVDAGALASVFSTAEDIVNETVDLVKKWKTSSLPEAGWVRYGERFSIKVNPKVARFLRIDVPADTELGPDFLRELLLEKCQLEYLD